ncbi:MAG: GNAT family N-acetyltransferase [Pseudomonas sp.]
MHIELATNQHLAFAAALTQSNMREYYEKYRLPWDAIAFELDWKACDNYLIRHESDKVGIIRLWHSPSICHIRDLQVAPAFQGQGIGTFALRQAVEKERNTGSQAIRLKVFQCSPASSLYKRHGFIEVRQEPPLVGMELAL